MTEEAIPDRQIQSHFVRAGRQGDKRRDWSLFIFFRVMSQQEIDNSFDRITGRKLDPSKAAPEKTDTSAPELREEEQAEKQQAAPEAGPIGPNLGLSLDQLAVEFANPTLWLPFVPGEDAEFVRSGPARLFRYWLKAIAGDGARPLIEELQKLTWGGMATADHETLMTPLFELASQPGEQTPADILKVIDALRDDKGADHGLNMLKKGLVCVCAYELIRQICRALEGMPVLRSAAREPERIGGNQSPIEIAFTYQGLRAAGVGEQVLRTFPDVLREGMAARASRLGDVGKSAPSQWAGELGQPAIHGMFVGGFAVAGAKEKHWARLRNEIKCFNDAGPGLGKALRAALNFIARAVGIEIVHIELGQDPYNDTDGTISWPEHRHEHFGFRDGISQPFIDLDLGDPKPGGGTPARHGSWGPLAAGELYLGLPDEDGGVQAAPAHKRLRDGGAYLVFRKLEQDVGGFRTFLAAARPGSEREQKRLAAQFVGRWQNGVSMLRAPIAPPDFGDEQEDDLNNFRYAEEDPLGRRCPLGAHVRRSNPRDIGGQSQARRHRLLRRGIAYGGPFLAEGSVGDGKERGMLFIALNARIDVQFELIQSRWINSGEFLGQAGLGKCPIIGANTGAVSDRFFPADSLAPVNRIPPFVRTRGGDYFYAPGIEGIVAIASEEVKTTDLPWGDQGGHGEAETEDVFSEKNLRELIRETLTNRFKRVEFEPLLDPKGAVESETTGKPIVFIGQYADVEAVLSGAVQGVGVRHYTDASERMMVGGRLLIGTESGDPNLRAPMKAVLERAWEVLKPYKAFETVLDRATRDAIRRTRQVGHIDLVQDLAVDAVYRLISDVYGVRGPNWLTELSMSLPFARQHVSELHPDWFKMLSGKAPENPRLATLQIWSILMFSDLIGNLRMQEELKVLSMQAASEFTIYLEQVLAKERARPKKDLKDVRTLVEAFRAIEGETFAHKKLEGAEYYQIVRLLLTELIPSALAVIPATFGSLMVALLANRANLAYMVEFLEKVAPKVGVERLIYETNRLSPSLPLLQRYAKKEVDLGKGLKIKEGEWIGVMIGAANFDRGVFPEPEKFSLAPWLPGPDRDPKKYLMFGAWDSDRQCWGRDRLAMMAVRKFVCAAAELPGLRRVAGVGGAPVQILRTMIGLPARFARF